MQKVKRFDHPPDLEQLFESFQLQVRTKNVSVTTKHLCHSYLKANEQPATFTQIKQLAADHGLSVVAVEDKVIFRRLMKPMGDGSEVQRASGDAVCEICQFKFNDHPHDIPPNEFLYVLCNGRRVKL